MAATTANKNSAMPLQPQGHRWRKAVFDDEIGQTITELWFSSPVICKIHEDTNDCTSSSTIKCCWAHDWCRSTRTATMHLGDASATTLEHCGCDGHVCVERTKRTWLSAETVDVIVDRKNIFKRIKYYIKKRHRILINSHSHHFIHWHAMPCIASKHKSVSQSGNQSIAEGVHAEQDADRNEGNQFNFLFLNVDR